MNFTKPLEIGASIIAIATLLTYTNIIPSNLSNIILVLLFTILYLLFNYKREGFSLIALIPIIAAMGIIIINKDPSMASLILIWIIYDISNNAEIDIQGVAKSFLITGSIGYVMTLCAYFTIGLNKHADLHMWRINHMISRASLGFQQPNTSMLYALALVMSALIAYKASLSKAIIILSITSTLYIFNQSRTSFLLIILIVVLDLLNITWPFPRILFTILTFVSYALVFLPINNDLDQLLSGRITLYHQYFNSLGVHLLNNPLSENTMLDSSYIQMILSKGLIFTVFFIISLFIILKSKSKLGKTLALAYILSAFTETTFLHFELLFQVLLASNAVFKGEPKNDNTEKSMCYNYHSCL